MAAVANTAVINPEGQWSYNKACMLSQNSQTAVDSISLSDMPDGQTAYVHSWQDLPFDTSFGNNRNVPRPALAFGSRRPNSAIPRPIPNRLLTPEPVFRVRSIMPSSILWLVLIELVQNANEVHKRGQHDSQIEVLLAENEGEFGKPLTNRLCNHSQ